MEKHKHLKKILQKIVKQHPFYGTRRIKKVLEQEYNLQFSRKKISKLLGIFGLKLPIKKRSKNTNQFLKYLKHIEYKSNLLIDLKVSKCCQVIVTDITEIKTHGGKLYIVLFQERFTRKILGYNISKTMDKFLVLKAWYKVERVLKRLHKKNLLKQQVIIHQDRGSQFLSYDYINTVLRSSLTKLSYSAPASPQENPYAESLFSRLKEELEATLADTTTLEEAKRALTRWVRYYNNKRAHSALDYKTPSKAFNLALTS